MLIKYTTIKPFLKPYLALVNTFLCPSILILHVNVKTISMIYVFNTIRDASVNGCITIIYVLEALQFCVWLANHYNGPSEPIIKQLHLPKYLSFNVNCLSQSLWCPLYSIILRKFSCLPVCSTSDSLRLYWLNWKS